MATTVWLTKGGSRGREGQRGRKGRKMRGGVAERGGTGRGHRKENKREERSDDGGGVSLTLEHDPSGSQNIRKSR